MKFLIAILSGVLLAACGSSPPPADPEDAQAAAPRQLEVDRETQEQLGVQVQAATPRSSAQPITSTGQLQLNEDRTWHVGAVVEGRVVKVIPQLGDHVREGEIMAQLHSHDVHDSRADRRQADAELKRLQVVAEQAQRIRDRTQRLLDLKAASREQMEEVETQYRSALLNVKTAQAQLDRVESHLTEFLDVPLEGPAEPDAGAPEIDTVPVRAPADGTVMERLASVGTVVSAGDPVVVMSDLSSLWLIAAVNEADLSDIRPGQQVDVTVRAYPGESFRGKVFRLGEQLDPQTRTLQIRVLVSNPRGKLKPGMFANANFATTSNQTGIYVPESAVQELNGRTIVFVQTPAAAFEPKEVTIGRRTGREVEIVSGIAAGTPVVVNGAILLKGELAESGLE